MFEQDYLMRLLTEFAAAMRRSLDRAGGQRNAIDAAHGLEDAIGAAVDLDKATLLSLAPESVAQILSVSGADPKLAGYMSRSLLLASRFYEEGGEAPMAELRRAQAHALAEAFGHELTEEEIEPEALDRFFEETGVER